MSKRTATDFDNSHARISNIDDGDKGSVPVSGPVSSDPPANAPSAISSMTVAALKAQLDANFIKYNSKTMKAALATLLLETLEARSNIPRLNEDVQGYIVSFLSGFDSLHMATQLARGFRLRAKPRLDSILKRSDADIKVAAKAWCEDAEAAREIYGPISIWNTSEVTEMSFLFCADDEDSDEDSDDETTYQIVGEDEADLKFGKISVLSPISRALIGKDTGDVASVNSPSGVKDYEIIKVEHL